MKKNNINKVKVANKIIEIVIQNLTPDPINRLGEIHFGLTEKWDNLPILVKEDLKSNWLKLILKEL